MGFGSTAKKIQKLADVADELYTKVTELKTQLQSLQGTVETTNERVEDVDRELARQRVLLEALAEEQGIDTDAVLTDAAIEDAEDRTGGEAKNENDGEPDTEN